MAQRDYYEILNVERTCTEAELKTSFRKAAMQHHPDRNPGDPQAEVRFKECNEAYSVLSDPQKRAAYDRFGHAGVNGQNGGGFQGVRGRRGGDLRRHHCHLRGLHRHGRQGRRSTPAVLNLRRPWPSAGQPRLFRH